MKNYFYIITFDGQIFELSYTPEKLNSAVKAWKNGELLMFSELGGGIHANSISKIMSAEQYESYTFQVKPKLFIKNGTWYDGLERKMIRHEPWKQKEIDSKLRIESGEGEEISPEERKRLFEQHTPDFIKEKRDLADKIKV